MSSPVNSLVALAGKRKMPNLEKIAHYLEIGRNEIEYIRTLGIQSYSKDLLNGVTPSESVGNQLKKIRMCLGLLKVLSFEYLQINKYLYKIYKVGNCEEQAQIALYDLFSRFDVKKCGIIGIEIFDKSGKRRPGLSDQCIFGFRYEKKSYN